MENGGPAQRDRRHLYIVDDSPTEAGMARAALAGEHDVTVFHDGSALLEQLAAGRAPDLLVLDWVMPGMTGIEVLEFLRQRSANAGLPVLLLTAQQQTAQIVEGLSAGADDYLCKPFAPAELRARVSALLRNLQLRERTEHAEGMLRRVLDRLPDAVLTADRHGRIVYVNSQTERLFARPAASLVSLVLAELVPELSLNKVVTAGQSSLPDVHVGDRVLAPRISIPPHDDQGNTTISFRDVTDLRRSEERRLDFYSMVAHDMRSPLSAMLMRAQLLMRGQRGPLSLEAVGDLEKMSVRIRELVSLINDFLDLSQIEGGRFRLERERVELCPVFTEVVDEYRPMADAKQITLELGHCEGLFVQADERRISQVLANLLSNAIKYTPVSGTVKIQAELDGELIRTKVIDDGQGIAAAAIAGLFQKWARVPGTHRRVEGTGLGLLIVREIVEAHGGTVGVDSESGRGSVFWFTLPRASHPPVEKALSASPA